MPDSYTTVQGDTWDMIGFKLFGKGGEKKIDRLIKANINLARQVFFPAGMLIQVPADIQSEPQVFEGLPPWKR